MRGVVGSGSPESLSDDAAAETPRRRTRLTPGRLEGEVGAYATGGVLVIDDGVHEAAVEERQAEVEVSVIGQP